MVKQGHRSANGVELYIWSMGSSAVTLPLKTRTSPTPNLLATISSHHHLGQCWDPMSPFLVHNWMLTGPVVCWACAGNGSYCEFMKATSTSGPEDSIYVRLLYCPPLTFFLHPLLWCSPTLGRVIWMFSLRLGAQWSLILSTLNSRESLH